ncbi:MAG TPA: hypothetical protein VMT17_18420 [Anaeromyxobacteraceae bacterium]|nr:hypothetical protein [Anaeromyxobacteraceae bacterium]
MKMLMLAVVASLPSVALSATWTNAPLVDHNCAEKVKADPDAHTTACLLQCAGSGYGILEGGQWIKFDKAGNEKAIAALKATHKKDHVRVNVTGELKGSVLHVSSLTIPG